MNMNAMRTFSTLRSQELSSLCFPPIFRNSDGVRDLDAVVALNNIYDLLQLHRRAVGMMEELEVEQLKSSSDLHYQHLTNSRLKVWLFCYIQIHRFSNKQNKTAIKFHCFVGPAGTF